MVKYLIAILLATALGLGVATYQLIGKLAVAEADVSHWTEIANQNAKTVLDVKSACEITVKTITDNQKAIDAINESRGSDLDALAALPQVTLPETHINASTKPTAAPTKNADDARLSPDLMRLLDNAYCSGAKADPYCTSR